MRSIYVYAAIISFTFGIAWQSIFKQGTAFVVLLLVLGFTTLLMTVVSKSYAETERHGIAVHYLIVLVIGIFAFTLGAVRMQAAQENSDTLLQSLRLYQNQQIEFVGRIVDEPDKREYSTNLVVKHPNSSMVLVRANMHQDFTYGEQVKVSGKLERVQNFKSEAGDGREFDYQDYLGKDDIYYIINRAQIGEPLLRQGYEGQVGRKDLQYWLFTIKQKYLDAIALHIPEPESALAGGITVGSKNSLGKELLDKFRDTGVIHIVVLSGFNVTIIAIFLTFIFAFAGPYVGRGLSAIGIILFALLTGGGATVLRASAMGLLALLALTVGRTYAVLRALFIVGFVMLLINPKILLSDISFQLSFIATLGMILGMPILQRKLNFITNRWKMQEIVAATIATQIAVSPLLLYYMGELSTIALLANILILPLVSMAMFMTFLTGVLGILSGVIATPFAYVAYALLGIIISIVELLAELPFATIIAQQFSIWWIIVAYVVMGALVAIFKSSSDNVPIYIR